MPTTMDYQKTMQALKRLRVETGSLACFGCGHEHNCSTQGCAILRNAVGHMEAALANYDHLSALTKQQAEDIQALGHATLTPPNEPLTLEQLREMDGEPVWFDTIKRWGIVKVCQDGTFILTKSGEFEAGYITRRKYYRRPPEG